MNQIVENQEEMKVDFTVMQEDVQLSHDCVDKFGLAK